MGAFEEFAQRYVVAPAGEQPALAEEFIRLQQARSGFPIVGDDNTVVFFYCAQPGETASLIGDFATRAFLNIYWSASGLEMERLGANGTVFIRRMKFESDAVIDYAFRVNGQYRLDSLNPHEDVGGPQGDEAPRVSELRMRGYRPPAEAQPREGQPKGQVISVEEPWAMPAISIYLPPGYSPASRYPVLYTPDGSGWKGALQLPTILDNLIADHAIVPAIAVMIDTRADRGDWYQFNPEYLSYVSRVVAYVDERYSTQASPEGRIHIGTSAGGRAALQVALEKPDLFRKVALLSPGLNSYAHVLGPYFAGDKRPDRRIDVWMSAGTHEVGLFEDAKFFDRYLARTHVRHRTEYVHAGHTFSNWRQMVRPALTYFLAPAPPSSRGTR